METHLAPLILDLGLILMAAAVMTLIFKKLNQPIILGYLVAGFLVSPYFPSPELLESLPGVFTKFFNAINIRDQASVHTWSEIGVIFMLFGLGLEFSFKKLVKVGKTALITAVFEIGSMIIIGYIVGHMLGWSMMDSLFLGAILSMSSTTIIVKTFDELKLKGRGFASIVFGVLVVEDLIAILLLVILSSVAVTQTLSGSELIRSSFWLVFFLVLWFLMGIYLLPLFLRKCRDILTDEILLIVSVGLCMMMVVIAVKVGFSAELGAFVMGSIFGETSKGNKIEHLTLPVKDLFSAVFFVSVGMRIDPSILHEYFGVILLMTVVTIVGKFFGTSIGALLSGCSVKNSTQAGMSMAQIGEFSFIIATLGMSLKVTGEFLYPIVVAVSAVTTFTTPYLIKSGDRVSDWLNRRIPERIHLSLLRYEVAMTESGREGILSLFWKAHGLRIFLNSIMVIGITLGVQHAVAPLLGEHFFEGQPTFASLGACAAAFLFSAPFLWGVFRSRPPRSGDYDAESLARLQQIQLGATIVRFIAGCLLGGFLVGSFTSIHALSGILIVVVVALHVLLFSHLFEPLYGRIEERFVSHLTEKERAEIEAKARHSSLAPWDVTLTEFELLPDSPLVAKTLMTSRLRNDYGVTVTMIERGSTRLLPPRGNELLMPYDKIFLIGTDEQLAAVRDVIERKAPVEPDFHDENFGLVSFLLDADHPLAGKTIRDCGLRSMVDGMIVGIERGGFRYLNPGPEMALHADDMLWLVGDKSQIAGLKQVHRDLETENGG